MLTIFSLFSMAVLTLPLIQEEQLSVTSGFALPIAIVAKCEEKIFLAQKNMIWQKQVAKKNSPHKKIATEISPINKLQCTEYLSNNYFNPLIYLLVLLTVSYMYL